MTVEQFNEKYNDYLEKGHYGLAVNEPEFITWLDEQFQTFIKEPGFKYAQIKSKFTHGCFYCNGIDRARIMEVEDKISKLYK